MGNWCRFFQCCYLYVEETVVYLGQCNRMKILHWHKGSTGKIGNHEVNHCFPVNRPKKEPVGPVNAGCLDSALGPHPGIGMTAYELETLLKPDCASSCKSRALFFRKDRF
ncbi:hypothetical protein AV530_007425 [Patagioenas fasciata monilis]|uniref:Uncharacterized protein n=1 Tax=Patagioenas fasciata monilis TaxID=372326 RepID=A0A1V4JXP4_PATFA|nr:hypothetical protein AV530_007425 [Patagioenas fasciata monilis]